MSEQYVANTSGMNTQALQLLLQLAENQYYNSGGPLNTGVPNPQSQQSYNAPASRGAHYALERRINALREALGSHEQFNPQEGSYVPLTDQQKQDVNHYLTILNTDPNGGGGGGNSGPGAFGTDIPVFGGLANAGNIPGFGGYAGGSGSGPNEGLNNPYGVGQYTTDVQGVINGFGGALGQQQANLQSEEAGLRDYLTQRYSADASKAGTLSTSRQSQQALKADVDAGLSGADAALRTNADTLAAAQTPQFSQNQTLNPSNQTGLQNYGTVAPVQYEPQPASEAPESQPASTNLVSGGSNQGVGAYTNGLSPQARSKALKAKQS
jgi:hypothetical protein